MITLDIFGKAILEDFPCHSATYDWYNLVLCKIFRKKIYLEVFFIQNTYKICMDNDDYLALNLIIYCKIIKNVTTYMFVDNKRLTRICLW